MNMPRGTLVARTQADIARRVVDGLFTVTVTAADFDEAMQTYSIPVFPAGHPDNVPDTYRIVIRDVWVSVGETWVSGGVPDPLMGIGTINEALNAPAIAGIILPFTLSAGMKGILEADRGTTSTTYKTIPIGDTGGASQSRIYVTVDAGVGNTLDDMNPEGEATIYIRYDEFEVPE